MSGVDNFKDLRIWQESIVLAKLVYQLAGKFPGEERYGLRSQLTRAVVSMASNIAEGSRRRTTKDLIQFLGIALGSAAEVETQLIIACEIGLLEKSDIAASLDKVETISRGIVKLRQTLEKREI